MRVIETEPDYTIAYYNAACCYAQLYKSRKAVEMLERAFELDKQEDNAYGLRDNAATDQDFDTIRNDPEFILLLKKYR